MYHTLNDLLSEATEKQVPLWRIILENEQALSGKDEESIFDTLNERYGVMCHSATAALNTPLHTFGGLIDGIAKTQNTYAQSSDSLCGGFLNTVMARALSSSEVNASMGKICAAPTAGACGIVPAVLISVSEKLNLSRRATLEGLLTASGVGAVITENASVSGAEGGCQAECGSAAAMAAAAAVQMAGGSNEASLHAVAFAFMNCMGLACDPVAGLVQVPCAQRNASQAMNAMLSADLALAGNKSIIPVDEVIESMYLVGKMLPYEIRETALGGIAATHTAKEIQKELFPE